MDQATGKIKTHSKHVNYGKQRKPRTMNQGLLTFKKLDKEEKSVRKKIQRRKSIKGERRIWRENVSLAEGQRVLRRASRIS